MRGRKPKPTALKIRDGDARKNPSRVRDDEPPELPFDPTAPPDFDEVEAAAWGRIGGILAEMGLWSLSYQDALIRYCRAWANAERAHAVCDLDEELKWEGVVRRWAVEFGLTPSSKTRVAATPKKETKPKIEGLIA